MKAATSELFPNATCVDFESGNITPDSCPEQDGVDAVFNFMNYLKDRTCLHENGEFTCGQIERMYKHWILYRDPVNGCDSEDEMEIEILILFDKQFHAQDNSFFLQNLVTGELLFESDKDHLDLEVVLDQDTLVVDLCGTSPASLTLCMNACAAEGVPHHCCSLHCSSKGYAQICFQ